MQEAGHGIDVSILHLMCESFVIMPRQHAKLKIHVVYLDLNEMSGRSYLCTCPQTILLSEKENRICTLLTHR